MIMPGIDRHHILRPLRTICWIGAAVVCSTLAATAQTTDRLSYSEIERLLENGVYSEAARQLETHVRAHPGDREARRLLARTYLQLEEYYKVNEQAQMLLVLRPNDPDALAWLERSRREIERIYPETVARLQAALRRDPNDETTRRALIDLMVQHGDVDEAIEQFLIIFDRDPEKSELRLQLARMLSWAERYEESIAAYNIYLEDESIPASYANEVRFELAAVTAWNGQPGTAARMLQEIVMDDPDNLDARVLLGDLYRWNDDSDVAERIYNEVLAINPEHAGALQGLVEIENLEEARGYQRERLSIGAMEQRVADNPDDQDSRLQLARLYGVANRYPEAEKVFWDYLARSPDDTPVRRELALALSVQEKYPEAVEQLRIYLEEYPEDLTTRIQVTNLLMWQADYEAAVDDLLAILEIAPDNVDVHWNLGRIYQIQLDWEYALKHYRRIIELDPSYQAPAARIRQILGNPFFRIESLDRQITEDPNAISARLELGEIFIEMNRFFEARAQADAILRRNPNHLEARRLLGRAETMLATFRAEEARELEKLLAENPDDHEARLELARIYRFDTKFDRAAHHFRTYLRANPEDSKVRRELAQVLTWMPDGRREAIAQLSELTVLFPEDDQLRLQLLQARAWEGVLTDEDRAERRRLRRRFDNVIEFDPDNIEALLNIAALSQLDEDLQTAIRFYNRVLEIEPGHPEAQDAIRGIETLPAYTISEMRLAVADDPESIEKRLELAEYLIDQGLLFEAREEARKVLTMDSRNEVAKRIERQTSDVMDRQRGERLRDLRVEMRESPGDLELHLELAQLLRDEGNYAEALRRYQLYLRAYPHDLEVRREYADTLSWTTENYNDAVKEFRHLIDFYPYDFDLRIQFARLLTFSREHWDEAEEQLLDLMLYDPANPEILLLLADVYRYQGHYEEARMLYRDVIALTASEIRGPTRPRTIAERRAPREWMPAEPRSGPIMETVTVNPTGSGRIGRTQTQTLPTGTQQAARPTIPQREFSPRFTSLPPAPLRSGEFEALPGLEDYYQQARLGLAEIDKELRPQIAGFIGWMSDNDNYSEFMIGARYYHFLDDGTRLHIGLTGYRFGEKNFTPSTVSALALALGIQGKLSKRITALAELVLTRYNTVSRTSLGGTVRATYDMTPSYDLAVEYSKYDAIQEVKTVQSLAAGIDVDRFAFEIISDPAYLVEGEPFFRRIFFDGRFSYAAFSDSNRQTAYYLRPYYRFRDNPTVDLAVGWRGLSYSFFTPLYWSPLSYNGPFIQGRISGDMIWDITYDARAEVMIPNESGGAARSLSAYFQREFLEELYGGVSIALSENPRQGGFTYRYFAIVFDVAYRF